MRIITPLLTALLFASLPAPALAQHFPFERSFDVDAAARLDVSTIRGAIEVVAGEPGRVVVTGRATVRVGWNVPADAVAIARRVAAAPPVTLDGPTVRLRPPAEGEDERAVTIDYVVRVPVTTPVMARSDSGAIAVRAVGGPVAITTQSGAIGAQALGGTATIETGSGDVTVDGVRGALRATTSSSAIDVRALGGDATIVTGSGAVDVASIGDGDLDIETGSSGVSVRGARGALRTASRSGRIEVTGTPGRPWRASTGSSAIVLRVPAESGFTLAATTGSGSVRVRGASVTGTVDKRTVSGTVGNGGETVRLESRSGSIEVTVGGPRQTLAR